MNRMTVIGIFICICGLLFADNCGQFFQAHQQQVIAVPVQAQQIYYSAGENIRIEALVKQLVRKEIQALAKEEVNTPSSPVSNENTKYHYLRQHCAKCHSKSTQGGPKKGIILDGTEKVKGLVGIKALRSLRDETMPPNTKLPDNAFPELMNDILNLEYDE